VAHYRYLRLWAGRSGTRLVGAFRCAAGSEGPVAAIMSIGCMQASGVVGFEGKCWFRLRTGRVVLRSAFAIYAAVVELSTPQPTHHWPIPLLLYR